MPTDKPVAQTTLTVREIEEWRAVMMINFRNSINTPQIDALCDMALRAAENKSPTSGAFPDTQATAKLIAEIDALEKKATPGPWERDFEPQYSRDNREHYKEHFLCSDNRPRVATAFHSDAEQVDHDGDGQFEDLQARADLDFIAAQRNSWPTLKAALTKAAREDWIPVTERLPERSLPAVLVVTDELQPTEIAKEWGPLTTVAHYRKGRGWWTWKDGKPLTRVTKWMPVPLP